MQFTKTEWHQVSSEFKYDCPDDAIIETFGSVDRFKELLSHQEQEFNSKIEPTGENLQMKKTVSYGTLLAN